MASFLDFSKSPQARNRAYSFLFSSPLSPMPILRFLECHGNFHVSKLELFLTIYKFSLHLVFINHTLLGRCGVSPRSFERTCNEYFRVGLGVKKVSQ